MALVLVAMAALHSSQTALIVCVVVAGTFLGITNTLMTQVVMESAPVERPVASAAYSFVRFCGGAIAPFVAGKLAEHVSVQSPFYLGAAMTAISVGLLWFYRRSLVPTKEKEAVPALPGRAPMVIALGGPAATQVSRMAVPLVRARQSSVLVLHALETDLPVGEAIADLETPAEAQEVLEESIATLSAAGVPVSGELLHTYGSHLSVADSILRRAAQVGAGLIVVGPDTRQRTLSSSVTAEIAAKAPTHVVVINPDAGPIGTRIPGMEEPANPWS
jgi:nucleotide-binding universal stress UspA family protein